MMLSFQKNILTNFLEYVSLSEDEFHSVVDKFRSPHIWGKNSSGEWKLRRTVFKDGLDD